MTNKEKIFINLKKDKIEKSEKIKKKIESKNKTSDKIEKQNIKKKHNENKICNKDKRQDTHIIKRSKKQKKENVNINILNKKFHEIFPNIQGDIDNCESDDEEVGDESIIYFNDSLEKSPQKNDMKIFDNIIKSRNYSKKDTYNNIEQNKVHIFKYPKSFKTIINNNLTNKTYNRENNIEDLMFKEIIERKFNRNKNKNISYGFRTDYSTEDRTKSKNKNNPENLEMITNNDVIEFNYEDNEINCNNILDKNKNLMNNINRTQVNINTSFNVLNKETIGENMNILFTKGHTNKLISRTIKELKYWLDNLNLVQYLDNFIDNDILDINKFVEKIKYNEHKLNYDEIESLLKIHKPGHIYRIFCSFEILAGLINQNVANFLIKKVSRHRSTKSKNELKISISQEIKGNNSCSNCKEINLFYSHKKNDLNQFLLRYNLNELSQNFYHNGFDMINYIMVQMFSSDPINEIILENCFHIYEPQDREKVLKCLLIEKEKINYFLNSKEYLQFNDKFSIKYEDVIFKKTRNIDINNIDDFHYEKIIIPDDSSCNNCLIV